VRGVLVFVVLQVLLIIQISKGFGVALVVRGAQVFVVLLKVLLVIQVSKGFGVPLPYDQFP
jgi:hypothetical protein